MKTQLSVKEVVLHGNSRWVVDLRRLGEGRKFFETKTAAVGWAKDREFELQEFGTAAANLPLDRRLVYMGLEEKLNKLGATVEQAVDFFLTHHRANGVSTISKALARWEEDKKKAGRSEAYLEKMRSIVKSIYVITGDINCHDFTAEHAQNWIDSTGWTPDTKAYAIRDGNTFFSYCIKKGLASINPFGTMEKISRTNKPPGILTVDDCMRLMNECLKDRECMAYATLALFSGIRPEEVVKMDWSMIDIEGRFAMVPAKIAKDRRRRIVDLSNNAIAWMMLADPQQGTLRPTNFRKRWNVIRRNTGFAIREEFKRWGSESPGPASGIEWVKDCMRHSFASYHIAMYGSADKTALQMGHSDTKMLFNHYREIVKPRQAREFWAIFPRIACDTKTKQIILC